MRLTAIGVVLGVAAALAFGGVLRGLLFEVGVRDASTLAAVAILLPAAAALASSCPPGARRGSIRSSRCGRNELGREAVA